MLRAPSFWYRSPGFAVWALWPLSCIYGAVSAWRMNRPASVEASVPVICVGNMTVGGAGKTPTAIALANIVKTAGYRPGFLTRGYGGTDRGPVMVSPAIHGAAEVGDEPLLLAVIAPTVVATDRGAGAAMLQENCDVIIMDDGFQNPKLAKDFSVIVLDAAIGWGNGFTIPAGPLRVPVSRQLSRADLVVSVGPGHVEAGGLAVLRARIEPVSSFAGLSGTPVIAFAGIGRPEKFFDLLESHGMEVVERHAFADHAVLGAAEADRLIAAARSRGAHLLTTEKDLARMAGRPHLATLRAVSSAIPVKMTFDDEAAMRKCLLAVLTGHSPRGAS